MSNAIKKERLEVPIWHKPFLTIEEATAYTGIGRDTLREMTRFADCPFVLWVGHRRMIKRELFDEYIENPTLQFNVGTCSRTSKYKKLRYLYSGSI